MNKPELVAAVAGRSGLSRKATSTCLAALVDVVCDEVSQGRGVGIPGFLRIAITRRGPRMGRNPRTGETVEIPAGTGVKLKPGARLRDAGRS